MYFTLLDVFVYSLAIGLGAGTTAHLSDGLAVGTVAGVVAFVTSFALFELFTGRRK